jgi:hypothetical protein
MAGIAGAAWSLFRSVVLDFGRYNETGFARPNLAFTSDPLSDVRAAAPREVLCCHWQFASVLRLLPVQLVGPNQ